MHPPTHTLTHLQAVWTLLYAQFGHCRLQTSDRNIHAITLIQYLLHGVKWRGEIKKAKQVPVKNQHVGPKWWPGAHNVETERCMVGAVLGCVGQLSQWGALGCLLLAMALSDCAITALLRAARVAHSQYCGGCEQLLGAFKKPRVSGWQTGVLGHKYNKEIFTYFYLYIIYLYMNYLYYKSYITVRRLQNPTLRLQLINDLWDSIGWGWTPWHPIHGGIPPCFFIMPPNKGWEHTVLKGTARDKKMEEARAENAERRQTLSLNAQRSISLHFYGLFTGPME